MNLIKFRYYLVKVVAEKNKRTTQKYYESVAHYSLSVCGILRPANYDGRDEGNRSTRGVSDGFRRKLTIENHWPLFETCLATAGRATQGAGHAISLSSAQRAGGTRQPLRG